MIYAAITRKTERAVDVGAYDDRPPFHIVAFTTKSDFDEYQKQMWECSGFPGQNLVRVPRRSVERWFGRGFTVAEYPAAATSGVSIGGNGVKQVRR